MMSRGSKDFLVSYPFKYSQYYGPMFYRDIALLLPLTFFLAWVTKKVLDLRKLQFFYNIQYYTEDLID